MEPFWNPSFSSVVFVISPFKALMEDRLQEIAKYGISGKKLHEGLTEDDLINVGEGKFKILISSPKSLSERKIRAQLLKLRPKMERGHLQSPLCAAMVSTLLYCCYFPSLVFFKLMKERTISIYFEVHGEQISILPMMQANIVYFSVIFVIS